SAANSSGLSARQNRVNLMICRMSILLPPAFLVLVATNALRWWSHGMRPAPASRAPLAVASNRPSPLEVAVPRVCNVDATRLTCRNEPDGDDLCRDIAFVSDDVHVVTTGVNKRHPRCVHLRRAAGIVPLILCHGSCRDNDQGLAKMRVPACASSRLPNVVQDIPV